MYVSYTGLLRHFLKDGKNSNVNKQICLITAEQPNCMCYAFVQQEPACTQLVPQKTVFPIYFSYYQPQDNHRHVYTDHSHSRNCL